MFDLIKSRPPARSLKDVDIPDSSWKSDFEVVDKHQSLANELMRISLLGIAGYGFLIKEVFMNDKKGISCSTTEKCFFISGAIALGLCLALVLMHRFFSTTCLYYQVAIMRSLKRQENDGWTSIEKEKEKDYLEKFRKKQSRLSDRSHFVLAASAVCFALGFICVLLVFIFAIKSM